MAKPRKTTLSSAIQATTGRKRDHPDFIGSSFHLPKAVNNAFNRGLSRLKDAGYVLDRSDIISELLERFAVVVELADRQHTEHGGPALNLEAILAAATDSQMLEDLARTSHLKRLLKDQVDQVTEDARQQWEAQQTLLARLAVRRVEEGMQAGDPLEAAVQAVVERMLQRGEQGQPSVTPPAWPAPTGWVFHANPGGGGQWAWHGPGAPQGEPPQVAVTVKAEGQPAVTPPGSVPAH